MDRAAEQSDQPVRSRREFLRTVAASLTYAALGDPLVSEGQRVDGSHDADPYAFVRGVNYYPSWIRSLPDLWIQYDNDAVRFELGLARALGFNSVRVWLGTHPWEQLGDAMWPRVGHFLATAAELGLTVLPVIFDSCGVEPSSYSGEVVPVPEAYRRALADPRLTRPSRERLRALAGPYAATVGKDAWCPYSAADPSTILWQWHAPSPGYSQLGEEHWPKWAEYLKAVLSNFGNHPAVLMWDLMNEPNLVRLFNVTEGGGPGFDQTIVHRFLHRMRSEADNIKPRKLLTIGFESAEGMRQMAASAEVLSFHSYEPDVEKLGRSLTAEKAFAAAQGKPLLLTEAAAVLFVRGVQDAGDSTQLELYRRTLPTLARAGVGYYAVALMAGRFPFSWVGFYRPDGSRKPVADYIETFFKAQE